MFRNGQFVIAVSGSKKLRTVFDLREDEMRQVAAEGSWNAPGYQYWARRATVKDGFAGAKSIKGGIGTEAVGCLNFIFRQSPRIVRIGCMKFTGKDAILLRKWAKQ